MPTENKERFAGLKAQMAAAAETRGETTTGLGRFKRRETVEQDNTTTKSAVEETAVFKILNDSSLDPKEKAQKVAELLFFNEEDLEANATAVAENQAMVAQLLADFVEHNKQSIMLTRDNPLSELRTGIRDVFEKYHTLVQGREDLKEKLTAIDEIISKHGGPEGLITALLNAKTKEAEKKEMDDAVRAESERVSALTSDVRDLDRSTSVLRATIEEQESDRLLFLKGEKKRQIAAQKEERIQKEADLAIKRQDLAAANEALSAKTVKLDTFMATEDYQLHQKILGILDIGTDEFKGKLTDLSNVTLGYIDDTSATLAGVRAQLEKLLGRVTGVHTLTQNTAENVAILIEGQEMAQRHNATKMQEIESSEVGGGVEGMKREKKLRALHQHVSAVEKTTQSTASVSGELGKVQVSLTNFKDQMQEGLADSIEQQMLAVGSAAMTGNATLMRIESLATFVQGLVTKGQYMSEAQHFLGDMAKEMERSLMSRMAKNEGLRGVADVLKEMTDAMDDRNDVVLELAKDRKGLIDRLIDQSKELARVNQDALGIESEINREVYLKKDGEAVTAEAPSPLKLG